MDDDASPDIFPPRPDGAPTGSLFYERADHLSAPDREELVFQEITSGNVPDFVRRRHPVTLIGGGRQITVEVLADYLAIGTDDDFLRIPMSPLTAQRIADALGCILPTTKLVDAIYAASTKQIAIPIPPPGADMVLLPRFRQHNDRIEQNRQGTLGELLAGHKKDVVVTRRLAEIPQKVAIYGFFRADGTPWQPFALPHEDSYADYSHGIRLVVDQATLDGGETRRLSDVLADPMLAPIVSWEGVLTTPRYAVHAVG